jgi:hypothetical protein
MTHTPGPWKIDSEDARVISTLDGEDMVAVCEYISEGDGDLISTAPEMLKVLEKIIEDNPPMEGRNICPMCLRNLDSSPHKEWCWWGEAVKVIKKARGEE